MGDIGWEKNPIGKDYMPFQARGTAPEAVWTGSHKIGVASVWSILSLTGYNPESYSNLLQ